MAELPKGPRRTDLRSGDQGPGVICKACGLGIALGGMAFPASFEVKCQNRNCEEIRTYLSSEIQTLVALLKQ